MPKCRACGKIVKDSKDMIKVKNRTYVCSKECQFRYEESLVKNKVDDKDKKDRQELVNYIASLYKENGGEPNYIVIGSQIKKMKNEYNYKYKGMELALKFFVDVQGGKMDVNKGIGIIPYVYNKARSYYVERQQVIKHSKNFKFDDDLKIIAVNRHDRRKVNIIDMEDL